MQAKAFLMLFSLGGALALQDPRPSTMPKPPAPAAEQSPVPGRPKRHAFEGVYRLTGRVMNGIRDDKPSKGYLAITSRHLFLNLAAAGPEAEHPLVNAGVREWRPSAEGVRTTARLDWYSDSAGELHFVKDGKQEERVIRAVQGGLRVMQGQRTWLEFERVE